MVSPPLPITLPTMDLGQSTTSVCLERALACRSCCSWTSCWSWAGSTIKGCAWAGAGGAVLLGLPFAAAGTTNWLLWVPSPKVTACIHAEREGLPVRYRWGWVCGRRGYLQTKNEADQGKSVMGLGWCRLGKP
jgi:hypothetical protein